MNDKSTRERIVEAADKLFYEQGYERTSFAHVADAVQISRGNFYHHFKTKDQILDAVIELRLAGTQAMLSKWQAASDDPIDRIRSFINILVVNRSKIKRFGCPIGTLCTELAKLSHPAQADANELFGLFRSWLKRQFELLGRTIDADALAMHVLARSQGVATLASAFHDETFIRQEVEKMTAWLEAQAAGDRSPTPPGRRSRSHR